MTPPNIALEYRVPVEKMDIVTGNLAEMWGYLKGMIENDRIPLYAQDDLKGYLQEARDALKDLEMVVV